ncbi:hypothetical protein F8388_017265 [Cannabis sativa]|uniref:RNase H type-1 domain-containing protein n=1 Tax=Cannabis sativa TaxID=3483 RepID=A0A7J6FZF9_CANSA|nr:hypothetical protein F8388_017265 [Cannabis sativa]
MRVVKVYWFMFPDLILSCSCILVYDSLEKGIKLVKKNTKKNQLVIEMNSLSNELRMRIVKDISMNAVIFKSNQVDIIAATYKMLQKIEDFLSIQGNLQECDDMHKATKEKVWCIPNSIQGFLVTDASWKEGRAGIAVGSQDRQTGKWYWSAKALDADSAMEAEASAVLWAMQLGSECGFRSIAVASNALLLVQTMVNRKLPPCWKSRAVVAKIWIPRTRLDEYGGRPNTALWTHLELQDLYVFSTNRTIHRNLKADQSFGSNQAEEAVTRISPALTFIE